MSEPRVTRKQVEVAAKNLCDLAHAMGLLEEGERWVLDPGSPTYGERWTLYAKIDKHRHALTFTLDGDEIGATARDARNFLLRAAKMLVWVNDRLES